MELYQLEQFVAIAETGSMGKAAQQLYLSRAAISQNLKRLEQEMDCTLFEREHNRLTITPYGEIFLEHAKRILAELVETHEDIAAEKLAHDSVVRIGHFSMPLCYSRMPSLARSFPSCNFVVTICSEQAACEGLEAGDFDMAIVSSDARTPKGALALPLDIERACVSVPPSSPLFERDSISLTDLRDEKLFITDNLQGCSEWYRQLAEAAEIPPENIESVPAEEYVSSMSGNDRCHFSITQMVGFFGLGNGRKAILLDDDIATRSVVALILNEEHPTLRPIAAYLRKRADVPFDAYSVLPYLMFPGQMNNIEIIS